MRMFSLPKMSLIALALCLSGSMAYPASGVLDTEARQPSYPRAQDSSPLNLDGTFSGVVYYPVRNINIQATMVISGGNFRIESGGKRLLSGSISAYIEIMAVRGVSRPVPFGEIQFDGGQIIKLRPYRSGGTLKLLNRKLEANQIFRFCSLDACACRKFGPIPACGTLDRSRRRSHPARRRVAAPTPAASPDTPPPSLR